MTLKFVLLAERYVDDALRVILLRGGPKVRRGFRVSAGNVGLKIRLTDFAQRPLAGLA